MKGPVLLVMLFSLLMHAGAQKGCTDPLASNYNSLAKVNDGSCQYPVTSLIPQPVCPALNDTLSESSGLIYFNNWFWTHNDSDNPPFIYAFDSMTGKIIHTTFISNKTNTDWEDMTQDSLHIYIGDFGNNGGNRTDLKILVIKKSDLKLKRASDTVLATQINFSFADQVSFSNSNQAMTLTWRPSASWATAFTCSAKTGSTKKPGIMYYRSHRELTASSPRNPSLSTGR